MTVKERIAALREKMREKKIDAYLVPTDDFHASEYVKCASYYEAKSDEQIILDLGRRLKPENWPWKDDKELATWYLTDQYAEGGTRYEGDFEELQERGGYKSDP